MHKWVTVTLFLRDDVPTVRNDEMIILYAMVDKILLTPDFGKSDVLWLTKQSAICVNMKADSQQQLPIEPEAC